MSIELNHLSVQELEKLIADAQALLEVKRVDAVKNAKAEIEKIAADLGLSVEALLGLKGAKGPKKDKKPVAVKYRNPADATQTWTGRGKRPKWLEVAIANGATLESFAV